MSASNKCLLALLLLGSPMIANAQSGATGDYWIIHQQGGKNTHEVFVAESGSSLTVHRLYEGFDKPVMTTYALEVDCAKNRVRIQKAGDLQWDMKTVVPQKVSSVWQTAPDAWLGQSRAFVCAPAGRADAKMTALGTLSTPAMIDRVNGHFRAMQREEAMAPLLKKIDEAFENMPLN